MNSESPADLANPVVLWPVRASVIEGTPWDVAKTNGWKFVVISRLSCPQMPTTSRGVFSEPITLTRL